jgi:hypothetical protein
MNGEDTLERCSKTIQIIKRHRKQRHLKMREMTRDDNDENRVAWTGTGRETVCPVCLQTVRGDQDVMEAHVDACLAHESSRVNEGASQGDATGTGSETNLGVTDPEHLRGTQHAWYIGCINEVTQPWDFMCETEMSRT